MNRKLFVTGTGYSGSGCVLDWLREQPRVNVVPVRPFEYSFTNHGKLLLQHFIVEASRAASDEERRVILQEARERLAAFQRDWRAGRSKRLRRWMEDLLKELFRRERRNPNPEIKYRKQGPQEAVFDRESLERLLEGSEAIDAEQWAADWLDDKIRTLFGSGSAAIDAIDKSLPLQDLADTESFLDAMGPAGVVFTLRDPVDQVCDYYRGNVRRFEERGFETMLYELLERMATWFEVAQQLQSRRPEQVMTVRFEDFVTQHEYWSGAIAGWIGFTPEPGPYRHLDLEVSRGNIGLAADYPRIREAVEGHAYSEMVRAHFHDADHHATGAGG